MAVMLIASVPVVSSAKDRNGRRWRGRDNWDSSSWFRRNRKCRKFRNCHDARDGRWDGRGRDRDRFGNIFWRDRFFNRDRFEDRRWRYSNNDWRNRDYDWRNRDFDTLRTRRVRRYW